MQPINIQTRWAKQVTPANILPEYPRPQMVRKNWTNLNGLWSYAITGKDVNTAVHFDGRILVPFPIESALSGVKKSLQPDQDLWYKRTIVEPALKTGEHELLHFGAVDYQATVYVNGTEVGKHTGGYENFTFDITDQLKTGSNELTVEVWDPSDKGPNPHGKQVLNPAGIMYTASSGMWQTVWLETVPAVSIESLTMTPDIDKKVLNLQVHSNANGYTIEAVATAKGQLAGQLSWSADNSVHQLSIKGYQHLWSPDDPFLYDLIVSIKKDGRTIDQVKSYFGMRKIEVKKDDKGIERIFLNNKYTYNLGTLDQGFWPDGLYTAPTDAALKFDIEAIKAMGFNTIRKHIKIEPARWYYHCDKLGMLVWQDMVNPANDSKEAREEFEKETAENLQQLHNYPSIITWVLFNEGWGAYDQARLTQWVKATDPSRIVDGHSGENYFRASPFDVNKKWANSDVTDVHAYPPPALADYLPGKARVLGEFGGIGVSIENHLWDDIASGWGYGGTVDPLKMREQYSLMADTLKKFEAMGLSGSIYTQPYDVESEQNGLMTYDRTIIKMSVATIRKINGRIWPVTRNYLAATNDFYAKVADTAIEDYATRLTKYQEGKRDSLFLRDLAIMAAKQNDEQNATMISRDYISQVKDLLAEPNLKFIQKFTVSSRDAGFSLFLNNLGKIALFTNPKPYERTVEGIIFKEQVRPLLNENPDWNKVDELIRKYKQIDGEFVIGLSVINYLNAAAQGQENGIRNVVAAATIYDDRFHNGAYNTWAWVLFKKSTDKGELTKALEWAKKELDRTAKENARYGGTIDTYANILYKLGRTAEALEWEAKAVKASPNDGEIRDAYEKMKKGDKTW
jgi:tetratricopeptide (TPR) repeat protein